MAATYRLSPQRRAINVIVRAGLALGLGEKNTRMLTVAGRKSGKPFSTPVTLVVEGGHEWIVAPYGERQWVKNLRVAGKATLSRGRKSREVTVRELAPEAAAPVIRRYVERVTVTKKYWNVTAGDSDEAMIAEAAHHPVFLIE
jgi:deazaflavin-dependent oxidoreductase (nitroreductase family)